MTENTTPPGWDYNPSAWSQRIPILVLAFVGFVIAGYMGLYQLNVFTTIWEPFFVPGSSKILNSKTSQILPIPDAVLGALSYLLDVVAGVIGSQKRWRTMPWIVLLFGFAVGPLGLTSLLLVVLQPVMYDTWCTLCLVTAAISIIMIGPSMDEVLASLQYLQRVKRAGKSWWGAFWGKDEIVYQVK